MAKEAIEPFIYSAPPRQEALDQVDSLRESAEKNFPGASYALYYSKVASREIITRPWMVITTPFSRTDDYAAGVFEGMSAIINQRTGVPNVVLLGPRTDRLFDRSLPSRLMESPITREQFGSSVLTFIAVNGRGLFNNPAGGIEPVRAYIRPTIHPAGLGGYGVTMKEGYPIDAAIISWAWPDYLRPEIAKEGGIAAINGKDRRNAIKGKFASSYAEPAVDSKEIKDLGNDELIYLAPYLINDNGFMFWADPEDNRLKLKYGAVADGTGEETFAITKDQKKRLCIRLCE